MVYQKALNSVINEIENLVLNVLFIVYNLRNLVKIWQKNSVFFWQNFRSHSRVKEFKCMGSCLYLMAMVHIDYHDFGSHLRPQHSKFI